jgi:hypothetical protein
MYLLYYTKLYYTALCCTYFAVLYCTALHSVLHNAVLHNAVLHNAVLHNAVLYCTVLVLTPQCTGTIKSIGNSISSEGRQYRLYLGREHSVENKDHERKSITS